MSYYSSSSSVEVTKREVFVAAVFFLISLGIGFLVANSIRNYQDENNKKFHQAVQLADSTKFNYAFKTDVGHTLAYGTVFAVGSVSDEGVGPYMSIHRVHEVYTMHTRTVCTGDGKNRHCHTETYWTWDYRGHKDWCVSHLKFLGRTFRYSEFARLPGADYVKTVNFKHHHRYVYYAQPLQYTGTLYGNIVGHNLYDPLFKNNVGLDKAVDAFSSKYGDVIFWVVFMIVVIVAVIAFVAADNEWLNGRRSRDNRSDNWYDWTTL